MARIGWFLLTSPSFLVHDVVLDSAEVPSGGSSAFVGYDRRPAHPRPFRSWPANTWQRRPPATFADIDGAVWTVESVTTHVTWTMIIEESGLRIAVTGASGRIGNAVVAAAVADGHSIVALDRAAAPTDSGSADPASRPRTPLDTTTGATDVASEVKWLDVTDLEAFAAQIDGCDAMIHLAAVPSPWGRQAHDVHANNVVGSYHAFLAAAEVGIHRVAWASSINAIGGYYSQAPRFDYFPVDEEHPTYAEDAYSLSKWLGEQQADAMIRLHPDLTIASIRLHGARAQDPRIRPRSEEEPPDDRLRAEARHLWGWVDIHAVAGAFLSALGADLSGHEAFFVVAPTTTTSVPSAELRTRYYPDVPVRRPLEGRAGFYDCGKAAKLLGWTHDA